MHARTLFAVTLAALLAAPAARAQTRTSTSSRAQASRPATTTAAATGTDTLSVGGFVGFETGDLTGFALRLDGEMPFQQLSPQVKLSFVGSLGYTHFGKDVPFGDITFNIVKVVPAARFTLPVNPQIDLYGDAGLGLYYYSGTTKVTFPFTVKDTTSGIGVLMRFGAGGFYRVNPKLRIGAELGVVPYFNEVDTTDFTIMVGAMFSI